MSTYHQPLMPDMAYHLFSRAVGNEKLFLKSDNYHFFLQRLKKHTSGVCSLYCYALLPNHFHLLVRIHGEATIISHFEEVKKKKFDPEIHSVSDFIMERFSNCLNSYTKSFNKMYKRLGGLFIDNMKRSVANTESDFRNFVWYIHKNPVHHYLTKTIGDWKFDSYNTLISNVSTSLLRDELLNYFGGKDQFIVFHNKSVFKKMEFAEC